MKNRVLVISVHPDDETLGCGGTILKHLENGDEVYCAHVTEGNSHQKLLLSTLEKAFGFKSIHWKLPEIILEDLSLSKIIPVISNTFKEIQPNIIYLPNRSDPHSDHRRTFDACQTCIKTFRYPFIKKVMMMEIISETDFAPALPENIFIPHVFVDISKHIDKKLEILELFESELLEYPKTRSIDTMKAYNRYRGSQISAEYAECFMLIKEIL